MEMRLYEGTTVDLTPHETWYIKLDTNIGSDVYLS